MEEAFTKQDVTLIGEYIGEAYGMLTQEAAEAIRLVAQKEGILLDLVYTAKAMAGLIDLVKKGGPTASKKMAMWSFCTLVDSGAFSL